VLETMQNALQLNERYRLQKSCGIALLSLAALYLLATQAMALTQRGGAPPTGWSWSMLVLIDLGVLWGIGSLLANLYRDRHTTITGDGVTQHTLFGTKTVRWVDIDRFTMIGDTLQLPGKQGKIAINTLAYTESNEAILDKVTRFIGIAAGDVEDEVDEMEEGDEGLSLPPKTTVI